MHFLQTNESNIFEFPPNEPADTRNEQPKKKKLLTKVERISAENGTVKRPV